MRRKKWYLWLSILIILLVDTVCVLFLLYRYAPEEAFDLFEAFFRYQFLYNNTPEDVDSYFYEYLYNTPEAGESYFFEIEGQDPPANFMARFSGHSPRVKAGSDFVLDEFGIKQRPGILFLINSWKWLGWGWLTRDHAEISGGYEDPSGYYYATYIFKRDKKGWALDNVGPVFHVDKIIIEDYIPRSP